MDESEKFAKKQLVDSKELSLMLGVKEGWIRQHMKTIPHYKVGRLARFNPKEVMERFKTG